MVFLILQAALPSLSFKVPDEDSRVHPMSVLVLSWSHCECFLFLNVCRAVVPNQLGESLQIETTVCLEIIFYA